MSLLLAVAAFACLAAAMNRHHAEVIGGKPSRSRAGLLRVVGAIALLALLAFEMTNEGAAFGALLALGYASAGAGIVLLTLTLLMQLRPRR